VTPDSLLEIERRIAQGMGLGHGLGEELLAALYSTRKALHDLNGQLHAVTGKVEVLQDYEREARGEAKRLSENLISYWNEHGGCKLLKPDEVRRVAYSIVEREVSALECDVNFIVGADGWMVDRAGRTGHAPSLLAAVDALRSKSNG
jgi:hypothetical protein